MTDETTPAVNNDTVDLNQMRVNIIIEDGTGNTISWQGKTRHQPKLIRSSSYRNHMRFSIDMEIPIGQGFNQLVIAAHPTPGVTKEGHSLTDLASMGGTDAEE